MQFNWTCGFCGREQIATESNAETRFAAISIGDTKYGRIGLGYEAIRCLNSECNEVTLGVTLDESAWNGRSGNFEGIAQLHAWSLLPQSLSVVQPDYIPIPLREDYYEACLVREKSPKAAATLARRCLQGMIRDFCGISKSKLADEIKELRKQLETGVAPKGVESETVDAIDAVRAVGNIGAHMEKDINLIIDVDANEARALIGLIEMLFSEWYVARHKRQAKLADIMAIAAQKEADKKQGLLP